MVTLQRLAVAAAGSGAGLLAAEQRFRRVRGYKSLAVLLANIDAYDPRLAGKTEAA